MSEFRIYALITVLGTLLGSAVAIGLLRIGAEPVYIFVALVLIGGSMSWTAGAVSLRYSRHDERRR